MEKGLDAGQKRLVPPGVWRKAAMPAEMKTAAVQSLGKRMRLTINEPERANISTSG